jgi:ABC-type branched-subunit amino acid transport system ATPase component/MFS family permease
VRAGGQEHVSEPSSLREVIKGSKAGWYPIAIITAFNFVDELDRAAMAVFAPDIRRAFDLSNAELGGIVGLQVTLVILLGIPIGYLGTKANRARLLRISAAVWGVFSAATGLARGVGLFIVARLGSGIGKASVEPVGRSLLSDQYPPSAWNRIFALHSAANPAGNIVGPLLAGLIGVLVAGDGAWRWAFPLLAIPTIVALIVAQKLTDPDESRATKPEGPTTDLPIGQAVSRMMRVPTFYRQLVGIGVFGFALIGVITFSSVLYDEEFGIGEGGRGAIIAFLATASLAGNLVGARIGEKVFNDSPRRAVLLVSGSIAVFSTIVAIAVYMPTIWLCVAVQWVGLAIIGAGGTPLVPVIAAISPPKLRPLAFAMLGLFVALFGGIIGGALIGAFADAWGIRAGLALLAPFGVVGALLMARAASTIDGDIATIAREAADEEAEHVRRSRGGTDQALRVRGLDFSYGKLQVLFDVDIDVAEGDTVALLGTNGAGKSTVLRAVTGLDLPDRGSVRYFGEDITWADAESRVKRGLVQVPGGRGTFPSLTVLENLRTGAYTFRRDKPRVEKAIEEVFGYFPVLEQRKNQAAGTMSGGEQQMLALGRAFVASPRLLMIDELSLGLAPVIVEQLLGIVRAFSAQGTTLVLVEQSVNLALTLCETAYFMERGEVRFSGQSQDLLERGDLLRSVFLEGAVV